MNNISPLRLTRFLQQINNEYTFKDVSKISGISQSILEPLHKKLKNEAYRIFEPKILDICIDTLAISGKINIVQIGANDGKTDDPIYLKNLQHGKKILLIEPQKYYRETLLNNYSNFKGDVYIENVAIGDINKDLKFYILKEEYWDEYEKKFGAPPNFLFSFYKKGLTHKLAKRLGVNILDIEKYITTLDVEIAPLHNILKKYNFNEIDLLQIDAEGYDFQIINSLGETRPKLINFESFRLTPDDWNGFKSYCKINGYGFIQGVNDTLAIHGSNIKYELYKQAVDNEFRNQYLR